MSSGWGSYSGVRPDRLREILHQSPRNFGKPTSLWTLELAAEVSFEQDLTASGVSDETIRATLARQKVSWQRAKHWNRFAQPNLHTWAAAEQPLRLVELARAKDDPDRKALACSGLLTRRDLAETASQEQMWLCFVDGRPVSAITTQFLDWCCPKVAALGKRVLALVWDNAA